MKIATCTVSLDGFGDPSGAGERIRLFSEVLNEARRLHVDLLCLPGGYLRAKTFSEKDKFSHVIHNEAKKYKIAIAMGIDVPKSFAICWSPNEDILYSWQQRSSTRIDQWNCPAVVCAETRTLPVLNGRVEVLICGEIFNERIRNNILSRKYDLTAVVGLGHKSYRFRVWAGMKKLAEGGLTVMCSVHANRRFAQKYCYTPQGSLSTPVPDITFPGPPRLELKLWSLS